MPSSVHVRQISFAEEECVAHMAATKVWTLDELHSLPDDGNKYELIHGELFVTPAPTDAHETIAARLTRILDPYVEANGLGFVYRPRAVLRVQGSEVEPDLMVRQPNGTPGAKWEDAPRPSLIVEILSPTTRRRDRTFKKDFYLESGVPEYWIVDDESRTVTCFKPGVPTIVAADTLSWHPAGATGPLLIVIKALFTDPIMTENA
jgi:Uma2 family endonuclease